MDSLNTTSLLHWFEKVRPEIEATTQLALNLADFPNKALLSNKSKQKLRSLKLHVGMCSYTRLCKLSSLIRMRTLQSKRDTDIDENKQVTFYVTNQDG